MQLSKNIKTLNGVRGYAALWVVFFHLKGNPYYLSVWEPGVLIKHSYFCVDLFFIVSGFVLSHVYWEKFAVKPKWSDYRNFLALRLARMYPLHLLMFLAVFALTVLSQLAGNGNLFPRYSAYEALMNLTLLHAWGTTRQLSWNVVSWTVSAEWFAYLFLLIPCLWGMRNWPKKALYALLGFAWLALLYVYLPMHPEADFAKIHEMAIARISIEFCAGFVAYRIARDLNLNKRFADLTSLTAFACLILLMFRDKWLVLLLPLLILFLLGLSAEGPLTSALLSNRISLVLGELSYAVYMSHSVVRILFMAICERLHVPHSAGASVAVLAVYMALMLLTAYVLYHAVEEPCREWLRKRIVASKPKSDSGMAEVSPVREKGASISVPGERELTGSACSEGASLK